MFCVLQSRNKNDEYRVHNNEESSPKMFQQVCFSPSTGASGGILVGWVDVVFQGTVQKVKNFAITIDFKSRHNAEQWRLTTVYSPVKGSKEITLYDGYMTSRLTYRKTGCLWEISTYIDLWRIGTEIGQCP